jgi:hypothetical protein
VGGDIIGREVSPVLSGCLKYNFHTQFWEASTDGKTFGEFPVTAKEAFIAF